VPAAADDLDVVDAVHDPAAEHVDQQALVELVRDGEAAEAFEAAFEAGDELFETVFNALDGVGANVGNGQRFTRTPRADLRGTGAWANHFPERATGPNASSCNSCHNLPFDDGAGSAAANVHRDPLHSAELGRFIQRNTPHVFAPGAVQRLAEEMTERLHAIRDGALADACASGAPVVRALAAKGLRFGEIGAVPTGGDPCATLDTSGVVGVDADLVVRPFQWKGSVASLRDFNRGASHNELGMQSVEITGDGIDGDSDGIVDELTVGDQTALAVYLAAQPRPTTLLELARLGLVPALPREEQSAIGRGGAVFREVGCADCHVPRLTIDEPIFREPSRNPAYRDAVFPAGQDPVALGVDPASPVSFDLTRDQPDNQIRDGRGRLRFHLGAFPRDRSGRAQVDLYGDLRRHEMGPGLAESIDEVGSGPATFLTENLWGVGSTAPYMHDGRATTLTEAILLHGGESQASRDAFAALAEARQAELIAFLGNLVLFKLPEEDAAAAEPAPKPRPRSRR
jgi:mono/diheme cytochrome c family protein